MTTSSVFSRQFRRAASRNLVQQFGEVVTYRPRAGNTARDIRAMVERDPNAIISETGELLGRRIMLLVENNACRGILSGSVDTGGDEVSLTTRSDSRATTVTRPIVRVMEDDGPMVRVLLQ